MHILFLSDNFPPEVNAPASRTFGHCQEWVKAGCKVTVITCAPNFPKGRVFGGYRNLPWQTEDMAGIRVIRVWSYITANEGFFKRVMDYVSFMISSVIASLFVRKVDIVIGTSPQFFTACAAYLAGALKRRPWIFELRDIWPESIRAVGAMKQSSALNFLEKIELFLYRKATTIVSVTDSFRGNLIRRGVDAEKIEVVTNGVDINRYSPREKDAVLVRELGLEEKFVAGYIGTHGMAHSLGTVLDAARLCKESAPGGDRYRFVLLGDGSEKAALMKQAHTQGLDNVIFVDSVSKDEVANYWSILDVSIIHLKRSELFKSVIPSKLFECMGMAIPVLHGVEGESAAIVQRENVGLLFEPENPQALLSALLRVDRDAELRRVLQKNGPIAALRYDRAVLAVKMLEVVERAAGRNRV